MKKDIHANADQKKAGEVHQFQTKQNIEQERLPGTKRGITQ